MAHEHVVLTPEQAAIAVDYVRHKTTRSTLIPERVTEEGWFRGYASTFGDVFDHTDLQGDLVDRHAFDYTLERWRQRGVWPPLLFNHERTEAATMGVITNLYTDSHGLVIEAKLDLEHPPAAALYKALKARRITGLSISYAVIDEQRQANGSNLLLDVELIEISVVVTPANQDAQIVALKGATATTRGDATVTFMATPEPEWRRELKSFNDRLDALASNECPRDPAIADQVDKLILETRFELVRG